MWHPSMFEPEPQTSMPLSELIAAQVGTNYEQVNLGDKLHRLSKTTQAEVYDKDEVELRAKARKALARSLNNYVGKLKQET